VIFEQILDSPAFTLCADSLNKKNAKVELTGLSGASAAHFVCAFLKKTGRKVVVIEQNELAARKFREDLITLGEIDPERVLRPAPLEYMLYDVEARSSDNESERVGILYKLATGDWDALVLSVSAAMQRLPDQKNILKYSFELHSGDRVDITELSDRLARTGFVRVPQVDGRGQFAVRGDIVDIFPGNAPNPFRIEFFDNEIDTIRIFSTETQRTVENVDGLQALPLKETYIWDEAQALDIRTDLKVELFGLNPASTQAISLKNDIEKIRPFCSFPGYDKYLPYILGKGKDFLDYCGDAALFISEPEEAIRNGEQTLSEFIRTAETVRQNSGLPELTAGLIKEPEEALRALENKARCSGNIRKFDVISRKSREIFVFNVKTPEISGDDPEKLTEYVRTKSGDGYRVILLAESTGRQKLLENLLEDGGLAGRAEVVVGSVSESFEYPEEKLSVISGGGLFRRARAHVKRKLKGEAISAFAELSPGDLVVHDVHGIGRFDGIEAIAIDGEKKDYIKIVYRDNGVIFVPALQLESVRKYIGGDGAEPELSKLGSSEWKRATGKVKNSLRVYARELVELYARRSQLTGYAFSPDTEWQREFEADFPYEETEDQLRCTDEIKADMEKPSPMERLLCGDVGYGKTEVALRAAFKAVVEGKQVAFLVPTTILAQQHYNNFVERFKKYPIKIDYLSRFRTAKERNALVAGLAAGKVDIVVGTHALINDKIQFKNLGLVVIDEEQRFGVKHKEKLKSKYPAVDMLTLSATPIPRTLHMSLSGIRDISVIEDPPQDRLPVQTYVAEWDPVMVKNAIYKEMARHGQVFYLYNRVQTMDSKLRELGELVPEARIAAAHGQMEERDLENVMNEFCKGAFDILLCTNIIESGLDMPNVNTIIVENGERLGLSQLYQIRGRVGRSVRQAYAYITYPAGRELGEVSEKRLKAIRENTEFGSGFKIAMRDLEIRGAGSVLGEQQHGQIAAVGYETYCRLLAEVLEEERTGRPKAEKEICCNVEMNVGGFIDPEYIGDESERFRIYQKIARVEHEEDVLELTDELVDRFGNVPDNIAALMTVARIRHYAEHVGFTSVIEKDRKVLLYALDNESSNPSLVREGISKTDPDYLKFHEKYARRLRISRTKAGAIVTYLQSEGSKKSELADEVLSLLEAWAKIC
jgi:transcription-repair coupling factor (superfamily II helicase)